MKINILKTLLLFISTFSIVNFTYASKLSDSDTLIVTFEGSNQVRVICQDFSDLTKYKGADSLISVFSKDVHQANTDKEYNDWPQVMHYLVRSDGKRRLKMQSNEFNDEAFDLNQEKYRLNENLPNYHFIIYDLSKSIELHIYLETPDKLDFLQNQSIDSAIAKLLLKKKEIKANYTIALDSKNGSINWSITNTKKSTIWNVQNDVSVYFIGNIITPTIEFNTSLSLTNKYGVPYLKFGAAFVSYVFSDYSNGQIKASGNLGYDLRIAINPISSIKASNWFGIETGLIVGSEKNLFGFKSNAFRFAISKEYNNFTVVGGLIAQKSNKNSPPFIGVRLQF